MTDLVTVPQPIRKQTISSNSPLLTISVAACNVEAYIGECLESLCDHRFAGRLEVIVNDDGGTDGTMQIAAQYREREPAVFTLVHQRNGGWGSTVNYSIRHAHGKYFRILDGDDLVDTEALERELQLLSHVEADLVYTPHVEFRIRSHGALEQRKSGWVIEGRRERGENKERSERTKSRERNEERERSESREGNESKENRERKKLQEGAFALDDVAGDLGLCMHNATFRTALLQQYVTVPEHCFYTDTNYMVEALHNTRTVYLLHAYVYWYRKGRLGQSTSHEGFRRYVHDHETVILTLTAYMEASGILPCLRPIDRLLVYNLSGMVMAHYGLELTSGPSLEHQRALRAFDHRIRNGHPSLVALRPKCRVLIRLLHFPGWRITSILMRLYARWRHLF